MKFHDILTENKIDQAEQVKEPVQKILESKKPEDILRSNGYKIKDIFGTKFGTEYVMAKKYPEEEIRKVLKGLSVKFDENSIFVID